MQNFLRKWAGALLLLSALFALGALVAFGSQGRQSDWGWGFLICGVASLLGWFFGRRGQKSDFAGDEYSRQRVVLGFNAVLSVLLLTAILVGINYIATRRHTVFDLTQNRTNTLAAQTSKALDELKSPIKMTYVWAPSEYMPLVDPGAQSILQAFRNASDKVQVEFLNAAQNPMQLQSLGLPNFSGQPVLVIEKVGGKESEDSAAPSSRQEIGVVDEQNMTSAILKLNNPQPRVLYLLAGHGEQLMAGADNVALNAARRALESQNYTLQTLVLSNPKTNIPKDAAAILALGPQVDLSAAEATKLQAYLNSGGRLALFFQLPRASLPRWSALVRSLNIQIGRGLVLERDPKKTGGNPQVIVGLAEDQSLHPILRSVAGAVLFPGVLPLQVVSAQTTNKNLGAPANATALFETSINSGSLAQNGAQIQRTGDGPFALAVAVEKAGNSGSAMRAIVVGNASFAADGAFHEAGNGSFFLGAVNWVVGNDALVSIPPKQASANSITMTDAARNFATLFSLVALPLGVLLLGPAVWWKRR